MQTSTSQEQIAFLFVMEFYIIIWTGICCVFLIFPGKETGVSTKKDDPMRQDDNAIVSPYIVHDLIQNGIGTQQTVNHRSVQSKLKSTLKIMKNTKEDMNYFVTGLFQLKSVVASRFIDLTKESTRNNFNTGGGYDNRQSIKRIGINRRRLLSADINQKTNSYYTSNNDSQTKSSTQNLMVNSIVPNENVTMYNFTPYPTESDTITKSVSTTGRDAINNVFSTTESNVITKFVTTAESDAITRVASETGSDGIIKVGYTTANDGIKNVVDTTGSDTIITKILTTGSRVITTTGMVSTEAADIVGNNSNTSDTLNNQTPSKLTNTTKINHINTRDIKDDLNNTSITDGYTNNNDTKTASNTMQTFLVDYIAFPVFALVCVVGNAINIYVMLSSSLRKASSTYILVALAVTDSTFILMWPFNKGFARKLLRVDVRSLSDTSCKLFFFIFKMVKMSSAWFVTLISIERFIAIWFPLKAKIINTKKIILVEIVSIVVFLAVANGAWTVSSKVINGACIPHADIDGYPNMKQNFVIYGIVFVFILPTAIMITLSPLTAFKLCRQYQFRAKITNNVKDSRANNSANETIRATVMLLSVTLAFVVFMTPITFSHIYMVIIGQNIFETSDDRLVIYRNVSQVLELANFTINFFLYVLISKSYRDYLFGCWRKKKT